MRRIKESHEVGHYRRQQGRKKTSLLFTQLAQKVVVLSVVLRSITMHVMACGWITSHGLRLKGSMLLLRVVWILVVISLVWIAVRVVLGCMATRDLSS